MSPDDSCNPRWNAVALTVRAACKDEWPRIASLLQELGYTTGPAAVARLERLQGQRYAMAQVAILNGIVMGLVTAHALLTLHVDAPVAWITTLVVGEPMRGRGVGTRLVIAAENWARSLGAQRIAVTSGRHRADAHHFYAKRGYDTSVLRFTRHLEANG